MVADLTVLRAALVKLGSPHYGKARPTRDLTSRRTALPFGDKLLGRRVKLSPKWEWVRLVVKEGSGKRGKVALLIEQLSPKFSSFFFPRKTGKARKTGNISKIWKFNRGQNLKEGKIFWKASHSNFWETQLQNRKYGNTRKCAKKIYQVWKFRKKSPSIKRTAQKFGNLDEKSFDMNGPYDPFFFGPGRFALSQPYCSLDLPSLKSGYPLLFSYNNERIPTAVSCRAAPVSYTHLTLPTKA